MPCRTSTRRRSGTSLMSPRFAGCFFQMPAELVSHRRKQLVLEIGFAARAETFVKRGSQPGSWGSLVDRRSDRPASFAGVGNPACEFAERWILQQRACGQVEKP